MLFNWVLSCRFGFRALSRETGVKSNELVFPDRKSLTFWQGFCQPDRYYIRGVIKIEVCGLRSSVDTIYIYIYREREIEGEIYKETRLTCAAQNTLNFAWLVSEIHYIYMTL